MAKPVFLSMGGETDTKFATKVKNLLPDPMVYFYQRSGEEGVKFRPEIEAEIQGCKLFVIFWSEYYFQSEHAKLELALFKKIVEGGNDADLLVVPTQRKHPNIQGKWTNPINSLEEYILGRWRYERAVYQGEDPERVAENIRRKLAKARLIDRALISRPNLISQIKKALARANYQTVQFGFIWGYEGDGRRTALRQYMSTAHINLTPRYVSLDTTEGPEDLLLRLYENATPKYRREILDLARSKKDGVFKEIRTALYAAGESKSYYIIALSRFNASDSRTLPFWLADAFGSIPAGNAPLAFVIVSTPVTDGQMQHYPNSARVRIQGLEEDEMRELVYKLSQEDPTPGRWFDDNRAVVTRVSGNSPGLCHAIMYAMSNETTLEFLGKIAEREADIFAANISALVNYIVNQFKEKRGDLLALRIIERLGATSKQTLDSIFANHITSEVYDLYQLRNYGLVEHLSGDIYRIPPLVQRRLGDALWSAGVSTEEIDAILSQFASELISEKDDYGAVFACNKVAAQLRTNMPIPDELNTYLTTATLFKAGLERYTNNEFKTAHSTLKQAMRRLQDESNLDPITQIEIARYFGLASARLEEYQDVAAARSFLQESSIRFRSTQAKAMVAFLDGFEARIKGQYKTAVQKFEESRDLLSHVSFAERQRGAVLNELSRALLRIDPPNFERAVTIAEEAYNQTKVVHNLNALLRAMLARLEGKLFDKPEHIVREEIKNINSLLDLLTEICERSRQDFHLVRRSDLSRLLAYWHKKNSGLPHLDLTEAIELINKALEIKKFPPTISRRWFLKLFDTKSDHSQNLLSESDSVLQAADMTNRIYLKHALTVSVIIHARKDQKIARQILKKYQHFINDNYRSFLHQMIDSNGKTGDDIADFTRIARI